MRFDQIDLLVLAARNLGGIIMAGGVIGAVISWAKLGRNDPFLWGIWFNVFLAGLALTLVATGVLAQIVTARAAQDAAADIRAMRRAAESATKG